MKSMNPVVVNIMAIHARLCREDREKKVHALQGQAFMEIHCWKCQLYEQCDCPGITPKTIENDRCPAMTERTM